MLKVVRGRDYLFGVSIVFLLVALFLAIGLSTSSAHAANSASIDTSVTVKPSLTLNIPVTAITMNLDPANHAFDEQDLTVSVGTNNPTGYQLTVNTVGNASSLVNMSDSTKTIPTLASSSTPANFPANYWGIRKTTGDTSSGNYTQFTAPYDVSSSIRPVNNDQTTLGFGAKVDYTKPSGLYKLDLEFKALPIVSTNYMQDIASNPTLAETVCTEEPTVVIDKRDEQSYTIRRINGDCWMVENLQFTGTTMDSTTSNISPQYTPSNPYIVNNATSFDGHNAYYDLQTDAASSNEKCYSNASGLTGYHYACMHKEEVNVPANSSPINYSTDTTTTKKVSTVWYNYPAVSAGTIYDSNANPQLYDICPAGWRLPNDSEINNISGSISQFNPIPGGVWLNGTTYSQNGGFWWGSNVGFESGVDSTRARSTFYYDSNSASPSIQRDLQYFSFGRYVRCVMKNTNINNLTYMQDFAKLNESNNVAKKQQVVNSMELNSATGYSLKDTRDTNTYTINKIGPADNTSKQNVWMTKNLLFQGTTLNPTDTDVTTTRYINGSGVKAYYNLATQSSSATDYCRDDYAGNTPGYINACMYYTASDSNIGNIPNAWYNYAAASAGTITGADNSTTATESICPKGWTMPNEAQVGSIGNNTSTYISTFKAVAGGVWDVASPTLALLDRGYYWSTVILNDGINRYYLGYYSADPSLGAWGSTRASGRYVRCVAR